MKTCMKSKYFIILLAAACAATFRVSADSITVQVDKPGIKISPMFFGLMTEEINHSYDGGLYGELIRNRVFKDSAQNPVSWSVVQGDGAAAKIALDNSAPLNEALVTSLRLEVTNAADGKHAGVANGGYWGIPVEPDTTYRALLLRQGRAGIQRAGHRIH